jgi:hypothetical protein
MDWLVDVCLFVVGILIFFLDRRIRRLEKRLPEAWQ